MGQTGIADEDVRTPNKATLMTTLEFSSDVKV